MKEWLGKPESKTTVQDFLLQFGQDVAEVVTCLTNSKKLCAGREKMWTRYHKLRISGNFRMRWKTLFRSCQCHIVVHPVLYQRLTDTMFKKMLGRRITVIHHTDEDVDPLTLNEENALRYAAGYVCKQVKSKLKRSSHPQLLKEELIACMDTLREYGNETTDDSSRWTTIIDRGGLWHISDDLYRVFYAMEEEVRRYLRMNLHRQATLNATAVCDIVISNEDVQFYWCIVMAHYQRKHETLLLKDIAMQWITVRGFAYTSGWIEQYKQKKKTALQKKKSLRTLLQTSGHDNE